MTKMNRIFHWYLFIERKNWSFYFRNVIFEIDISGFYYRIQNYFRSKWLDNWRQSRIMWWSLFVFWIFRFMRIRILRWIIVLSPWSILLFLTVSMKRWSRILYFQLWSHFFDLLMSYILQISLILIIEIFFHLKKFCPNAFRNTSTLEIILQMNLLYFFTLWYHNKFDLLSKKLKYEVHGIFL